MMNLDLDGFLGSSIFVQMLIIITLKIEKLIIINIRMKSKTLFVRFITPMAALMATETFMLIFVVKGMISAA